MPVGECKGKDASTDQINSHETLIGSFAAIKGDSSLPLEIG
jgi:hypothetical protein